MQLHQPRLAEMVADILRKRILSGDLRDGDALPRQEDLMREFTVSKPSLREALRILEAEGLIVVRRGNLGGAIVTVPEAENAAYTIGLVLSFRGVSYGDVARALKRLEPVCAGFAAARDDRASTVLPRLKEIHEQAVASVEDPAMFTKLSRQFHEQLVSHCGNESMIVIVGALEALWSQQELGWAQKAIDAGDFPDLDQREMGLRSHERLIEHIETGDIERAERLDQVHLEESLWYALHSASGRVVEAAGLLGRSSGRLPI